jgi:hypothetical protein
MGVGGCRLEARFIDLPKTLLPEPLFVEGIAAEQVILERPRRPDTELGTPLRDHSIADGNDGV